MPSNDNKKKHFDYLSILDLNQWETNNTQAVITERIYVENFDCYIFHHTFYSKDDMEQFDQHKSDIEEENDMYMIKKRYWSKKDRSDEEPETYH